MPGKNRNKNKRRHGSPTKQDRTKSFRDDESRDVSGGMRRGGNDSARSSPTGNRSHGIAPDYRAGDGNVDPQRQDVDGLEDGEIPESCDQEMRTPSVQSTPKKSDRPCCDAASKLARMRDDYERLIKEGSMEQTAKTSTDIADALRGRADAEDRCAKYAKQISSLEKSKRETDTRAEKLAAESSELKDKVKQQEGRIAQLEHQAQEPAPGLVAHTEKELARTEKMLAQLAKDAPPGTVAEMKQLVSRFLNDSLRLHQAGFQSIAEEMKKREEKFNSEVDDTLLGIKTEDRD